MPAATAAFPNLGLNQFRYVDGTGRYAFDANAWKTAALADTSWDSASWASASWASNYQPASIRWVGNRPQAN